MGKLKVGDRVRVVKESNSYGNGGSNHNQEIGKQFTLKAMNNGQTFWRTEEGVDFYPNEIEVVSTLTIEAGKFYKTRDGRKVGPVTHNGHGVFGAPGFGQNRWYATGRSYSDSKTLPTDLVAEWIDEPKASNDNAEPAKSKFKVGDRVVARGYMGKGDCFGKVVSFSIADNTVYAEDWSLGVRRGSLPISRLELVTPAATPAIVALIEDGKVKPATRPKVHPDQATAATEAERLALAHPGQQFGVFVLADSKIADVVTETVQRTVLRAA